MTRTGSSRTLKMDMDFNETASLAEHSDLAAVTLGNVDLSDRKLLSRVREGHLEEAEIRIKSAVRRL